MLYLIVTLTLVQPPAQPPIVSEAMKMMHYYEKPDPQRGVAFLKELLKPENLDNPLTTRSDGHVLSILCEQLGYIAKGKPEIIREYEKLFASATTTGKYGILRALRICGDEATVKQISAWLETEKAEQTVEMLKKVRDQLKSSNRQLPRDTPVRNSKDLDLLWADFFATGEYAPISRLLDVLEMEVIAPGVLHAARWSLESNMKTHPKLVELIKKHLKERNDKSKAEVEKLLDKVQEVK